jgi:hypothetical protein
MKACINLDGDLFSNGTVDPEIIIHDYLVFAPHA